MQDWVSGMNVIQLFTIPFATHTHIHTHTYIWKYPSPSKNFIRWLWKLQTNGKHFNGNSLMEWRIPYNNSERADGEGCVDNMGEWYEGCRNTFIVVGRNDFKNMMK